MSAERDESERETPSISRRQILLIVSVLTGGALGIVALSDRTPMDQDGDAVDGTPTPETADVGFGGGQYGHGGFGE